jgi:MFS transporter, FHS family, L-fucose permease
MPSADGRVLAEKSMRGPLIQSGFLLPFILVTALFFLWGIPNNLNDVLIRQFMKSFAIGRLHAGLVQSAFYMGYFLLALPSALYMRKLGYKAGFVTGLMLFGTGTFLFWPAALVGRYSFFLFALFVMASGLAFLETASNTFIAVSGPVETSARRLNFSQAFNPLGSIAGAFIGTVFILSGVELSPARVAELQSTHQYEAYLRFETLRVVRPYVVLGIAAVLWAFLIWRTPFPPLEGHQEGPQGHARTVFGDLFRNRRLVLSILAQFFYVGAQVGTWSYFIQYVQDYARQPEKIAGYFLTGTLVMFGIGRFASAYVMKFIQPARLMGIYSGVNVALVALAVLRPGWPGIWAIFLTSFFMSSMFPTIFALGVEGLGHNSKVGGSLIVMAIVGGAVLTPLMGLIADSTKSLALAYCIPLAAYVLIGFYSFLLRPFAPAN